MGGVAQPVRICARSHQPGQSPRHVVSSYLNGSENLPRIVKSCHCVCLGLGCENGNLRHTVCSACERVMPTLRPKQGSKGVGWGCTVPRSALPPEGVLQEKQRAAPRRAPLGAWPPARVPRVSVEAEPALGCHLPPRERRQCDYLSGLFCCAVLVALSEFFVCFEY